MSGSSYLEPLELRKLKKRFSDKIRTIHMVHELIMCRDGLFNLCNDSFDKTDINLFIDYLCTS